MEENIKEILEKEGTETNERVKEISDLISDIVKKKEEKAKDEARSSSLISGVFGSDPKAAQDPIQVVRDVLKDEGYTEEEKLIIVTMSRDRFKNRRRMAYIALGVLVLGALSLILAIYQDGSIVEPGKASSNYSSVIEKNIETITWFGGFFISVIGFYFGASSLRPTS